MQYQYESFGDTLVFAESLGWIDTGDGSESCADIDELEQDAIEFIQSQGYTINF